MEDALAQPMSKRQKLFSLLVLILVVMEDALAHLNKKVYLFRRKVLILVVMEDALALKGT